MSLRIGDLAPNFTVETQNGKIDFHEWIGDSWAFFFSHPADFTPVCTTEMGRTAQLADEFAKRNVKPIGLSTDGVEDHLKWIKDVNDTQHTTLKFPIVADEDLKVSKLYDMIHPEESETAAVRSVFIIDPNKKIRLTMTYPMNVGRISTKSCAPSTLCRSPKPMASRRRRTGRRASASSSRRQWRAPTPRRNSRKALRSCAPICASSTLPRNMIPL